MSATSLYGLCAGLASKPLQLPPAFSLSWVKTSFVPGNVNR